MHFASANGRAIASAKTYRRRFGSQDAIAEATLRWASAQSGYEDVCAILELRASTARTLADDPHPIIGLEVAGDTTVLDDSYVPPVVACLPALAAGDPAIVAACRTLGLTENVVFEKRVAVAFRLLGLEVLELGQGSGRVADGIARCTSGRWALIYDAKLRRSGFVMGTEDRKFREYVATHATDLRREGFETLHFVVVSSSFAASDLPRAQDIVQTTPAKSCVLLEAAALLAMVELRLRTQNLAEAAQLHRVFGPTRIVTVAEIKALDRE